MPNPNPDPVPGAELIELLMRAASGVFPGAAIEALIARLEVGK